MEVSNIYEISLVTIHFVACCYNNMSYLIWCDYAYANIIILHDQQQLQRFKMGVIV